MELLILYFLIMSSFTITLKVISCLSMFFLLVLIYLGEFAVSGFIFDDLSFTMISLSLVLVSLTSLSLSEKNQVTLLMTHVTLIVVLMFFLTSNTILFMIFFEFSLIPVFFIILLSGKQPERLKAVKYMIMFTLVFSSPLLLSIFFIFHDSSTSNFSFMSWVEWSPIFIFMMSMGFLVKAPMVLLHSWLPKAHVEAPLIGSIILAGLMLKVGIYGLIRVIMHSGKESQLMVYFFFSVGIVGSVISILSAVSSDDMKLSVAFSSISHMNMCLSALASVKVISLTGVVVTMLAHGLSSPLLFSMVTKVYEQAGTRSMVLSKGLVSKFPLFQTLSLLLWILNISVPPFYPFIGEISMLAAIETFYWFGGFFFFIYLVMGSFYSMLNYGVLSHSSFKVTLKANLSSFSLSLFSFGSLMIMVICFVFGDFFFPSI